MIVFWIVLVLIAVIIAIGAYTFFAACGKRKDLPWLDAKQMQKTSYAKYTDLIAQSNQWLQDHDAKDIYMTNREGLILHGLWVPAENPRGTILLAHGYRSSMLVDFGMVLEFYHTMGMNLLLPEQRCHGKSQGKFITFGVKESRDMEDWIAYHNQTFGACPVILSGLSMGASTILYLADKELPGNVRGIIADCGFTTPKEILSKVFYETVHLPPQLFIWITGVFSRCLARFSLDEEDTRTSLRHGKLPVFMIHGTGDDFVPCKMTQEAYDACTSKKYLLLAENAGHGVSFLYEKDRYIDLLQQFLSAHLEG